MVKKRIQLLTGKHPFSEIESFFQTFSEFFQI